MGLVFSTSFKGHPERAHFFFLPSPHCLKKRDNRIIQITGKRTVGEEPWRLASGELAAPWRRDTGLAQTVGPGDLMHCDAGRAGPRTGRPSLPDPAPSSPRAQSWGPDPQHTPHQQR